MTILMRGGPPRAGPAGPLTRKTPVAAGVLWSITNQKVYAEHSASSDGTEGVLKPPALTGPKRRLPSSSSPPHQAAGGEPGLCHLAFSDKPGEAPRGLHREEGPTR